MLKTVVLIIQREFPKGSQERKKILSFIFFNILIYIQKKSHEEK